MKRYTFESDGYYAVKNDVCFDDQNEDYQGPAIDRLANYEDTGLEPQDVVNVFPTLVSAIENNNELKRYRALGTVEGFKRLKEFWEQVPMKIQKQVERNYNGETAQEDTANDK